MQKTIQNAILSLGLTELDSKIYAEILLSKNEIPSVLQLAQSFGIYRQKVVESLKRLQEKDLLEIGPRQKITVSNPKKLSSILKFQETGIQTVSHNFSEILPDLLTNFYLENNKPAIRVFEGKNQYISLFNQVLEETPTHSEILFLGEGEDFYEAIPFEYFRVWGQKRIKKSISAKVLARSNNSKILSIEKLNQAELREIKFLPKNFKSLGCVFIFNNNVVNWNTAQPRAVLIQDNQIADFYKNLFAMIWESC